MDNFYGVSGFRTGGEIVLNVYLRRDDDSEETPYRIDIGTETSSVIAENIQLKRNEFDAVISNDVEG